MSTKNTPVSDHFTLGDFLTHDQPNVWPKYLVLSPKFLDSSSEVGPRRSRSARDRHEGSQGDRAGFVRRSTTRPAAKLPVGPRKAGTCIGDAADIYIDDDSNGVMDTTSITKRAHRHQRQSGHSRG